MARTLVIPDIHEDIAGVKEILRVYRSQVEEVVCLGDYFDSWFHTEEKAKETAEWVQEMVGDPTVTLLLGNHDLHYLWPRGGMGCSGYHPSTAMMLRAVWSPQTFAEFRKLQFHTAVKKGKWILSHAGIHPMFFPEKGFGQAGWLGQEARTALRAIEGGQREEHWFWDISEARGGDSDVGGPFWMDWAELPVEGPPQIVGHTYQREQKLPAQKGEHWCLDTGLRHVGVIEGERLTVHRVKA